LIVDDNNDIIEKTTYLQGNEWKRLKLKWVIINLIKLLIY
jgi:hypothetical protein